MIRTLFASALALAGLGAAAASVGPELLGPRGEPLVVATADQAALQAATFEGTACPATLLFSGPSAVDGAAASETHILAFALRSAQGEVAVGIEDFPEGEATGRTTVLVFDAEGRLIVSGDPASLDLAIKDHATGDCGEGTSKGVRAPI